MRLLILTLALVLWSPFAQADVTSLVIGDMVCKQHAEMDFMLYKESGEEEFWRGSNNQFFLSVYQDPKMSKWTIVITRTDNVSCIAFYGEAPEFFFKPQDNSFEGD